MTAPAASRGSVFLVEDETMIRMLVSDMLSDLGYIVAAEAGDLDQAIRLAQSAKFDLAILDVNVNGKNISPVAEVVSLRNLPLVFATGYGAEGLPEKYRDYPALQKPFKIETLQEAIENALHNRAG
ncbi:response regulator [Bradyrhizobium sp. U87765 SZCCT0131]|uniref:response regulator n=1 Tax=unclassified Bradyrhizobium TaxID=2631580 RepID=UPI001BA866FC|nr:MULTISPECIES: response regulator [unclassified Bradyrhizobium]MBR1220096.1 response regulator [Bradyrhizobium sp. U87765 SZCCT0131]MBR1263448.1 response regulator [Bradyrhizobium sp. U87765 SZCCT0134]MBR1309017.1 response regulator [Bradyrhizobium sp. U87765 SZCCT0110]MBR1323780.1 response regulator [Bradyrhizobium sp. U87765 SZCCT0109]MBR1349332.1 response regulator [Bradyrhizobium sp. U87765 SZCCT0048]